MSDAQHASGKQCVSELDKGATFCGTGLATSLLYDLLKSFFEHAHFHDRTAENVQGMMTRLRSETLAEISIREVAEFIEATGDPGFGKDMQQLLRESEKHMDVDTET